MPCTRKKSRLQNNTKWRLPILHIQERQKHKYQKRTSFTLPCARKRDKFKNARNTWTRLRTAFTLPCTRGKNDLEKGPHLLCLLKRDTDNFRKGLRFKSMYLIALLSNFTTPSLQTFQNKASQKDNYRLATQAEPMNRKDGGAKKPCLRAGA